MSRKKRVKSKTKSEQNKLTQSNVSDSELKGCTVNCPFFPDMTCNAWEYDKEIPYIKRRADKKEFICGYDGHIIKSWTDEICPKLKDEIKGAL